MECAFKMDQKQRDQMAEMLRPGDLGAFNKSKGEFKKLRAEPYPQAGGAAAAEHK